MNIISVDIKNMKKDNQMEPLDMKNISKMKNLLKIIVLGFSIETEPIWAGGERLINCFKELLWIIMEAEKSNIYNVGWQPRDPRKSQCCSSSSRPSPVRIHSCSGEVSLCSIKTFNWLDEAHPLYEGNLLSSKSRIMSLIKKL